MKHRFTTRVTALAALTLALAACGNQATTTQTTTFRAQSVDTMAPITDDETAALWFVELNSPPTADGGNQAATDADKRNFRAEAKQKGLKYQERLQFSKLFNGLSIKVDRSELAKLQRLPSVKAIYPVMSASIPEVQPAAEPEMDTALGMTGADSAQNELGLTGSGIRVAVMDTGLDLGHPAFTGRIAAKRDLVGNAFNGSNTPVPGNNPDDCNGHGTHVAGIIGGNDATTGFKGVAPDAQIGVYRVFGCTGSTNADIMIQAMEQALEDGMHVLNMSIGSAFMTWPQYPTAKAATRLVNQGVTVVASIGNSGASGLYSAGAPGVGEKVIGVASYDNTHVQLNYFTTGADNTKVGYMPASPSPQAPTVGTATLAITASATNLGCDPLPANSMAGKYALISRGTCTFHAKALNAQNAGAAGVILYNNVPGPVAANVAGSPAITIPVVGISLSDGTTLVNRIKAGETVTIDWTNQKGPFLNPSGNLLSSFSSYGLAADLSLKPDIGGPGGLIRSAWPRTITTSGYNTISGTSMSSPHVAGTVALLLQAKPNTPSQAVRSILQNTAEPKPWSGNPGLGFLDHVFRQGAGMVRIDRAVTATTRVEPGKLSLGESESGPATRTLTLANDSDTDVTYTVSHAPALSAGGNTNAHTPTTGFATAQFSSTTVTVPARGTATVTVTITANSGLADRSMYGGYVVFTPQGTGTPLRVPYAGLKGDYQSIQVLLATANNFPWLARYTGTQYVKATANPTFTLKNGDQPFFLAHFEHQSRLLKAEVYDATSGKYMGVAFREEFLPRNSTATGFYAFTFDGVTTQGKQERTLASGTYYVKLNVLKALGDENNPNHWETWQSPNFTIAR